MDSSTMKLEEENVKLETFVSGNRQSQLKAFCATHKVSEIFVEHLEALDDYEIVIIADDSGSMATVSYSGSGVRTTRWQELKSTISILIDLATIFDSNGVDVHFLNRDPILNIKSAKELDSIFAIPPRGPTPLVPALRNVLSTTSRLTRLIFIATDGEPTTSDGKSNIPQFKQVLKVERDAQRNYVTILACTDNDDTMEYLNNWDKQIPHLDVVDDYASELREIQRCQGIDFKFSQGDYVVKTLIGAIDPFFDKLDEYRVRPDGTYESGCCTIL
jgi:hypothetical protein